MCILAVGVGSGVFVVVGVIGVELSREGRRESECIWHV